MNCYDEQTACGHSYRNKPVFFFRMFRILDGHAERIEKNLGRFFERDPVPNEVRRILRLVPFEGQHSAKIPLALIGSS